MSKKNKHQKRSGKKALILAAAVTTAGLIAFGALKLAAPGANTHSGIDHPSFTVKRGPLRINVCLLYTSPSPRD